MHRSERVQQLITETVGQLIVTKQIKDPRVHSLASVVRVTVTKDFSHARIYIGGYLSPPQLEKTVVGLNSAAGFVQAKLAQALNTRQTPRVKFFPDPSIGEGFDVMKKLADNP